MQRELAKALDPNWQEKLLDFVGYVTQSPGYLEKPRSVLEMGCGSGALVTTALKRGHDAWGIDNNVDRLAVGSARIDAFGLDSAWKTRMLQGDASASPFEPNRFDIVVGHQFIEHVPDPAGTISEMLRVAKPGGTWCSSRPIIARRSKRTTKFRGRRFSRANCANRGSTA